MPTSIQNQASSSCDSSGRVEIGRFPSTIVGSDKDYRIYFPPCYGQDGRTYPTIYLFHGGAHTDEHWINLGIEKVVEEMIENGDIPPILIVMPDGGELANNSSGGTRSFEGLFVDELLPFIETNFCAWSEPAGRAIGGISRGGYWALEIAFRNPELIASVGGHSAALLDTDAGPKTNPQETALTNDLGDLRIYFDIGQQDWLINEIQDLHVDMREAGVQHTWVLNEGQHVEEYWSDHLEEYLEWYAQPWPSDRDSYPLCILESGGPE